MKKKKGYGFFRIIFRGLKISTQEHKSIPILIFFITIFGGLLPLIGVYLPRIIIDLVTNESDKQSIIYNIIILCSIGCGLGAGFAILYNILDVKFLDSRLKEFIKLNDISLRIDYKYLEDANFRDYFEVSSRALDGDGMGFQGILVRIRKVLPLILTTICLAVIIGRFNWIVVLACLVSAIVVAFANTKLAKYIASKKEKKAKADRQSRYFNDVAYDFSYGKDIRVYRLEDKIVSDYDKKSSVLVNIVKDIENKRFGYGLLEIFGLVIEDAFAYYFVIKSYFDGAISLGDVSLYIGSIIVLAETFRQVTDLVTEMVKDSKYCESYYEFIDNETLYSPSGNRCALDKNEQLEIEFKNVSFKYPHTERWILKNFSFKINKGEKLAIVGTNGAGKSTIVKLITGLFSPNEGQVLINGIDVNEFNREELFKMFSVVYQDINIYPATIIENIIGTNKDKLARERAIYCLEHVGLKEKIESLPLQYDTPLLKVVEDNGVELSGGQNQKICIARALYKDGNMVILDEPTSALDALAEASIYQSFDDLVKHKTAIYISHRLSSTKFCDKIALFDQDGLKEYGNHEELMALKGEYYFMFNTQGKYYKEGVDENEN